ncbi:MAG TPA: endonuclease/exonuclease/phosphatase family protein [Gemmatimonadaceae bacterium]
MRKYVLLPLVALLSACATAPSPAPTLAGAPADPGRRTAAPLRVMSFNLRYNNTGDGPNAWPFRKAWVAQLIRFHDADVIGVQEALSGMLADLDTLLPEYSRVGVGRTDGKMAGEYSAIIYKRDRLEALENKTFWLSPTPEVPGSKGWDAALERIATWGRFRDRATGCEYIHLNTHFDHKGEQARQESARIIRERLATIDAAKLPLVMTGDLNSRPTSVGYRILTRDTIGNAFPPLVDGMKASREGHYGPPSSTVSGFRGIGREGDIIDYVLVSPGIDVLKHGILPDSWDDRFPSDHLPVLATLNIRCK